MSSLTFRLSALTLALLAGSGLASADDTPQVLDAVRVDASADASRDGLSPAYAGGQVAEGGQLGVLGNQSVMDAPYSFTSYTEELISNQQAASVGEVLLNDPAVRVARGFGNFQQVYLVRGLPVFSDDMTYNGLYGLLPRQYLASEFIERVQVLRGANTFLNGAAPGGSGLGGAVNVLPKRAPNEPLTRFTLGAQTGVQGHAAADIGRRTADGRFGVRVNAARRDGDSAIDGESSELSMGHIGVDFNDDGLRVSADLGIQHHRVEGGQPNITIGPGVPIPKAPDAGKSVGQRWTESDSQDWFGTLRAEYDFADNLTAWAAVGSRRGEEDAIFANPTVTNTAGDYTAGRFDNTREDTVITGETGVRVQFDTGAISHSLSLSGSTYQLKSRNAWATSATSISGNIYAPVTSPITPLQPGGNGGDLDRPEITQRLRVQSITLADQLTMMDERLLLTLGVRYQRLQDDAYDYISGINTAAYRDSALSPTVGVVYKITPAVAVYANYIEGLQRGERASANQTPPLVNANEALDPYKTKQGELGLKLDRGTFGGSISVYQSRKPIAGADANNRFRVLDHQQNTGAELMAYGLLTRNLVLLGGVSYLDADVSGNHAIGSPEYQANVNLEYQMPSLPGLAFDTRVIYTSKQYADSANTQQLDSWTRLDLGARYHIPLGDSRLLTLRGRVENVAGEDYWASAGGFPGAGYLTVGAPRAVLLSATLDF